MKNIKVALFIILAVQINFSCSKDSGNLQGSSALIIVNGIVGSSSLVTNFSGSNGNKTSDTFKYYNTALRVNYGGFQEISSYSGNISLTLSQITDTMHNIYTATHDFAAGTIHTLFLTGTVAIPDNFLSTDNPSYHPASDSSIGVRFVNLSPGSNPVSVNIRGRANGSEVVNLSYKGLTSFTNYAATATISNYVFEFRDAATGVLITSFTMAGVNNSSTTNNWRYRNVTIALKGLPGVTSGSSAQGAFSINNY